MYQGLCASEEARRHTANQNPFSTAPFPDKEFRTFFSNAVTETEPARMLECAETLTGHVLDKMGGFDIDGWAFRSPAKT